jgi:hypothetical protein
VQPNFFDNIIQQYLPHGGDFTEIGGVKGSNQRSMLPTGETVQFILAGSNVEQRLAIQHYLLGGSNLIKEDIIELEKVKDGEPLMSGRIILNEDYLLPLLTNEETEIKFGSDFPAKKDIYQNELGRCRIERCNAQPDQRHHDMDAIQ